LVELEFLGALHVELLRHRELHSEVAAHELFQTSTIEALLTGAFDGDVTVGELLEHGDLGLGTLNGLDGELIVIGGQPWKADLDCTLAPVEPTAGTPYAVVVPFSPGRSLELHDSDLARHLPSSRRPTAIRIDGRFDLVRVRSVARQQRPYPPLAEAIAHQHISELAAVSGTMVGFSFPDAMDGIEMVGWHLHFATEDRTRGGHVLGFEVADATLQLDGVTDLHVELPPAVEVHHGSAVDQQALRRLET
jgi:acetolactate decarboxylase